MSVSDLAEILRLHSLWLVEDPSGQRADLSRANLLGANLWGANLRGANLSGAKLTIELHDARCLEASCITLPKPPGWPSTRAGSRT